MNTVLKPSFTIQIRLNKCKDSGYVCIGLLNKEFDSGRTGSSSNLTWGVAGNGSIRYNDTWIYNNLCKYKESDIITITYNNNFVNYLINDIEIEEAKVLKEEHLYLGFTVYTKFDEFEVLNYF